MESLIADVQDRLNPGIRTAIPGFGRTLATAAEERGRHVRRAVHIIAAELEATESKTLLQGILPRQSNLVQVPSDVPDTFRCAWALVNIWLLARGCGALDVDGSLAEAEDWFLGNLERRFRLISECLRENVAASALEALRELSIDEDLDDLLPYVLEAHGPGSRLNVMRDSTTRTARVAKKERGVFYTPLDVAEYMVGQALDRSVGACEIPRSFDPACGTGVFLVTLLRKLVGKESRSSDAFELATQALFGADISPLAVESCVFVLLHECIDDALRRGMAPWSAWQILRLNFVAVDALRVENRDGAFRLGAAERIRLRKLLDSGRNQRDVLRPARCVDMAGLVSLQDLFPEIELGFDLLVGNPPYAALGESSADIKVAGRFASFAGISLSGTENICTPFIELMWRLTRPGRNAATLVVPLSIAYSQRNQFQQCRNAMSYSGGEWFCSFFDREPHALFGEDVKTRNAILIRREAASTPKRGEAATIHTGPLRKWTSRTRGSLFDSIAFMALGPLPVTAGIPKLGDSSQVTSYNRLQSQAFKGEPLWAKICKAALSETADRNRSSRVYVAGTAYNFLNVFRSLSTDNAAHNSLSESGVHCVECASEKLAKVTFAILSSRLVFWLWHVEGDGFHVSRGLLEKVPFGMNSFTEAQLSALGQLGESLWQDLQQHQIVSVNKGKTTFAFRPLACEALRDEIDSILIKAAGLPVSFQSTLRLFVKDVVVIDKTDLRRNHAMEFFVRED